MRQPCTPDPYTTSYGHAHFYPKADRHSKHPSHRVGSRRSDHCSPTYEHSRT
ncbi:MAG: hypothetical protein Q8O40_07350 [Chloroflexota bacterium]|nr:hypothetical protein [Chloroflexota bacterium]